MRRTIQLTLCGALAIALSTLTLAACGSSKSKSTSTTTGSATTSSTPASASPTAATTPIVTLRSIHATLRGQNHAPVAGKSWNYTVQATDASGRPLSGSVETDFVVSGIGVVGKETPAVHQLRNGTLHDSLTFPPAALGHPIMLVTVVHTSAGSVALGWPVNVTK